MKQRLAPPPGVKDQVHCYLQGINKEALSLASPQRLLVYKVLPQTLPHGQFIIPQEISGTWPKVIKSVTAKMGPESEPTLLFNVTREGREKRNSL